MIEIVAQKDTATGEGPIWDWKHNRLIWVDVDNKLVFHFLAESGQSEIISKSLPVASVALNVDGALLFAGERGLHLWRSENDYDSIRAYYEGEQLCFNDMIAGPFGQIYAGTIYWGEKGMEKTGKLYLIRPDRSISIVAEDIKLSNGLGFCPLGKVLYYTDSAQRCIYQYDISSKTGELSSKRVFVKICQDEGIPDGLTVDKDGFVWSANWYGGAVVRYDPDGKVERRIRMPVKQIASIAFGGVDLIDLYITSASKYWPSELVPLGFDLAAPLGGALYRIRMDVQGKREYMARL